MKFSELVQVYEVAVNNEVAHKKAADSNFDGGNIFNNRKSALLYFMKSYDLSDDHEVNPYFESSTWNKKYDADFKSKIEAAEKDASIISHVRRIVSFFQRSYGKSEALSASTIGERIRRCREIANLTPNALAKKSGLKCNGGQVEHYESSTTIKNLPQTRKRLMKFAEALDVPPETFLDLLPPIKGLAKRTDKGMGKYIVGTILTYAFKELPPVMHKQFAWYSKFKMDLHLPKGLIRTTRWTVDQKKKCGTQNKNESHLRCVAGYSCLPIEGKKITDKQWERISKYCEKIGYSRTQVEEMQKGEGMNPDTISITDLADKDLLGRYDAFLLRRQNFVRLFAGETEKETTSSTVIMHLITLEHLFEARHGGATQNQELFDNHGSSKDEWKLFCLNTNQDIRILRESITQRLAVKDTNAIIKQSKNFDRPLDEIYGFLKNFESYANANNDRTRQRCAIYYLLASFPLRINSVEQLRTNTLIFVPHPTKKDHGEVHLAFDKEILKNGRDQKSKRFLKDPKPKAELWLMDELYGTNTYKVLKNYVEVIRPKLTGKEGPYLFHLLIEQHHGSTQRRLRHLI